MLKFLFTAVNRDGQSVTQIVEADTLGQARYKLEIQGFTEVVFYESELSNDVRRLFDEAALKNYEKTRRQAVGLHHDNSFRRSLINVFKATWFVWALLFYFVYAGRDAASLWLLGGWTLLTAYFMLPGRIFHFLHSAHQWNRNGAVRFWARVAKAFNYISFVKIPALEIDLNLACADAREGDLAGALRRIAHYEHDPRVAPRLYKLGLVRIYNNARRFDEVARLYERAFDEGSDYTEERLDYALCLARRHRRPHRAKAALEKVFDKPLTALAAPFVPFCQGVIEVEDGNYSQAEFYLKQASKELEPYRRNSHLVGLRSEVQAFLALTLGRRGEKDEAARLFAEARPYLAAIDETELIRRCEEAIS
ncbi:MAG: hypothetical protein JSS81_15020 [Acidobacteria bacterium]|nr:hypothetical protein [Acidobacteriota bacterium]